MPLTQPARVREKKATAAQTVVIAPGEKPDNSEAIAAREARKAEARARQAEKAQNAKPEADIDPRKAVEAAIAGKSPQSRSADSGG